MNDEKSFLARWARRKQIAATDRSRQSKQVQAAPDGVASETSAASLPPDENKQPFDPASLPTIESIGAGSDVRAFLESGVPDDLARAALRRAWSLDHTIRDFVGLSENSWDFNAPGAMAGFGPIEGEEAGRILTRLLGEPDAIAAAMHPPLTSPTHGSQRQADESDLVEHRATTTEATAARVSAQGQETELEEDNVASDLPQHGRTAAPQSESASPERRSPILRRVHGSALPQRR